MRPILALFGLLFLGFGLLLSFGMVAGMPGAVFFGLAAMVLGVYLVGLNRFFVGTGEAETRFYDDAPALAGALLAAVVVLALGLRLYALDRGIWYDEMLMHVLYMGLDPLDILVTHDNPNNHLLFTFLARLSIGTFGDTAWAIRLPAVFFGVASILAIYGFARRFVSWQEALVAALLLAVSYHHVWFSQNARGYSALLFFSLLSSSYLIDALREGSTRNWLAYAAAAALGALTHLTIAFLFIGHFLVFLIRTLGRETRSEYGLGPMWTGFFQGFGVLGLLMIAYYAMILPDMIGGSLLGNGLQANTEWTNPVWAVRELFTSLQVAFSGSGVVLAMVVVMVIGMARLLWRDFAPVVIFAVPVGLAILLMASIGYTLFPRFFFFAMGFALVIMVHGAAAIGQVAARALRLQGGTAQWVTLAPALILVAASAMSVRAAYFPKQQFQQSIEFIEERRGKDDIVAVVGISNLPYNEFHGKGWPVVTTAEELDALLDTGRRTWVIFTLPVQVQSAYPDLLDRIVERMVHARDFGGSLSGGEIVINVSK